MPPAGRSPEHTPPHKLQGKLSNEAQKVSLKKTSTPDSAGSASVRTTQAAYRRRAAAEWVEEITGAGVCSASDHAFRRSLKDGTLLCKVLNFVRPGSVTKVSYKAHMCPSQEGSQVLDSFRSHKQAGTCCSNCCS